MIKVRNCFLDRIRYFFVRILLKKDECYYVSRGLEKMDIDYFKAKSDSKCDDRILFWQLKNTLWVEEIYL